MDFLNTGLEKYFFFKEIQFNSYFFVNYCVMIV